MWKQVCDYLNRLVSSYVKEKIPLKRLLWHIDNSIIKRHISWECEIVKGNKKIHHIQVHGDPLKFMVWDLANFYEYCLDEDWELCVNVAHIGQWQLETLQLFSVAWAWHFNVIDQIDVGQELDFKSNGESFGYNKFCGACWGW
jgi:hypothetical protein